MEPPKAFELTETYDEIIPSLHSIHQSYLRLFDDLDLDFFHHSFGEKELKRLGVSPDGFVQMVLQLAYFKVHGNPCATYESAATRQFHHGRTENVRTTCPETVLFTTAMENPRLPSSFKMQTLQYALQAHRKYMVDAIQGKGCDRHLLGLRLVAIENGMPLPAIFQDKSFVAGSYFLLSTSNMPATTFTGG